MIMYTLPKKKRGCIISLAVTLKASNRVNINFIQFSYTSVCKLDREVKI